MRLPRFVVLVMTVGSSVLFSLMQVCSRWSHVEE